MNKRVGILTTFTSHDNAYSLCNVVEDQLKMLDSLGIVNPVLIVQESGWWKNKENYAHLPHAKAQIVELPNVPCHNEIKKDPSFDEDVNNLEATILDAVKNLDLVLTHDIVYQPAAVKHNIAARKVAHNLPDLKWAHWIHSATAPSVLSDQINIFGETHKSLLKQKFPYSKYVFFNETSRLRIAQNFGVNQDDVVIIPHPTDFYQLHRIDHEVKKFSEDNNLLNADYVFVYPCRLDRGKNVEMMVKTAGAMKTIGKSVKAIVVDFHSTGGDKVTYRSNLKDVGQEYGLYEDLIFTSEYKKEWEAKVSREVVAQLYAFCNVFIMPSRSESYSLVAQEAALHAPIMVGNGDFPPFREILNNQVIWRQYSSNIDAMTLMDGDTNTNYTNERTYHTETALLIQGAAKASKPFQLRNRNRKERNIDYVAKNYLTQLFV